MSSLTLVFCLLAGGGLLFPAEPPISAAFDAGSIGACRTVAENHYECAVEGESDQDGRNRQASWYYFRLDSPAGVEVTIDLTALEGEYNYKPSKGSINGETVPVVSYDQKSWTRLAGVDYNAAQPRLRLRLTPERSPVWIAHIPPYTTQDLDRLLADIAGNPLVTKQVIGKTPKGRDLLLLTVNDATRPNEGKRVIWLMFRQHSWEAGSSWVGEGVIRALTSGRPGIGRLLRTATFKILPMCDPDGVARGGVRFNANGYDLNRNWDNVIPDLMPEIAAEKKAIYDWLDAGHTIEFFLTVHNTETAEYIDGPPFLIDPLMPELTTRFFHMLRDRTMFAPTRPPRESATTTVPGRRGAMTVVQALAQERKIPAYLMELAIARNPKLDRFPTTEDRLKFGLQLVYTLGHSVRPPRK